jgi:hypothetical protein
MLISGGLMIADRPMSKLKGGLPMKLSILQLVAMLVAIISALLHTTKSEHGLEMTGLNLSFYLFIISALLVLTYIILGERIVQRKQINDSVSSDE